MASITIEDPTHAPRQAALRTIEQIQSAVDLTTLGGLTLNGEGVFAYGNGHTLSPYDVLQDHAAMHRAVKEVQHLSNLLAVQLNQIGKPKT